MVIRRFFFPSVSPSRIPFTLLDMMDVSTREVVARVYRDILLNIFHLHLRNAVHRLDLSLLINLLPTLHFPFWTLTAVSSPQHLFRALRNRLPHPRHLDLRDGRLVRPKCVTALPNLAGRTRSSTRARIPSGRKDSAVLDAPRAKRSLLGSELVGIRERIVHK